MSGWQAKALRLARSAHLLLQDGDYDSAVNRAYFAMFAASQAALQSLDPRLLEAKTHESTIRLFGLHVIRAHGLDPEVGRSIGRVRNMRLPADYSMQELTKGDATSAVEQMDQFLSAVAAFLDTRTS